MKYDFMLKNRYNFPVEKMCRALNVGKNAFYMYQSRRPGQSMGFGHYLCKGSKQWNYITCIIGLADRKLVGYAVSDNLTAKDTVVAARNNARHNRPVQTGFIFHSDRGAQYASKAFTTIVQNNLNVRQSMSRKANCWDNSVAESFFKTIKCELINHQKFNHIQQLKLAVFEYIQWYNNHRIHQSLDYQTPNEVEKQFLTKSANVA